jgi:hypothetical protein
MTARLRRTREIFIVEKSESCPTSTCPPNGGIPEPAYGSRADALGRGQHGSPCNVLMTSAMRFFTLLLMTSVAALICVSLALARPQARFQCPITVAQAERAAGTTLIKATGIIPTECDFENPDPKQPPQYANAHAFHIQMGHVARATLRTALANGFPAPFTTYRTGFAHGGVAYYYNYRTQIDGARLELLFTGRQGIWDVTIIAKPQLHPSATKLIAIMTRLRNLRVW